MSKTILERLPCGCIRHIIREGARYHVTWWDAVGRHCSEPDCEVNCPRGSTASIAALAAHRPEVLSEEEKP